MKVRSHILSPFVARGIAVVCAAVFVTSAATVVRAAGMVGTGTAASCTDAALNAALAGGGVVTFNCGPDPVTIDISKGTGTKTIATDTTIDGGGLITISGGNTVGVFSVCGVNSVDCGVNFTVENLTIANGQGGNSPGGGISNRGGSLTVTNSTFTGNSGVGSGILNEGSLTITNSRFTDNRGDSSSILNEGSLTVINSTFTGNRGTFVGGCIDNDHTATGKVAGPAVAVVTSSTFTDNSGADIVGCIYNGIDGMLTVTNSTFSGNSSPLAGSIRNDGSMTVTNSTFTGNSGNEGGGIRNNYRGTLGAGTLTVTNSTFTGNSDGGIKNNASLTVTNSTFTGNRDYAILNGPPTLSAVLLNTIVTHTLVGPNCAGSITDGGHNLDDGTSCGFSTANGSLSSTDPQLDPAGLQDNGGPTETIALQVGSPAVNAGDESVCAGPPVNNLDQRGFVRPGSGHTQCSMGAYEADAFSPESCVGDCDGTGSATVDEIITLVNIALGTVEPSTCPHGVPSDAAVDVALIIHAVNDALNGCGSSR